LCKPLIPLGTLAGKLSVKLKKSSIMKRSLIYIAFSLFASIGAGTVSHAQNEKMDDGGIAGTWKLVPALPSDTAAGKLAVIQFNTASGSFIGNTGCNAMSGRFSLSGAMLQFKEQAVDTKNNCQGYNEDVFMANLLKVNHYKIENNVLQLMVDQTVLFKWARKEPVGGTKTI
jgi:heat shock protein HslJ